MQNETIAINSFLDEMNRYASLQSGEDFLKGYVQLMQKALKADFVFIGRLENTIPPTIATRFLAGQSGLLPNFTYEMEGTPCNVAVKQSFCFYPENVQILFPSDILLTEMCIEAYIGLGLYDAVDEKPLGIIAALYKTALQDYAVAEKTIRALSSRVTSELLREKSEDKLKKSEAKYRALVENAGIGIVKTDLNGQVLESNIFIQQLLGYSEQELTGITFREFVIEDELKKNIGALYDLLKNKQKKTTFNTVLLCKNGTLKYVAISMTLVFDNGLPDYLVVLLTDYTEEREREETIKRLRWIENNYRILYKALPVGIISINLEGVILTSNEFAEQMLGYDNGELDGKPLEILLPMGLKPVTHQKFVQMFFHDKEIRQMGGGKRVIHARKKDGTLLPVEITLSYGKNEAGEFAVAAMKDISEKEKAEKAQQSLHEKEVLMKEIHHRVKNNMQVISSLLQLQGIKTGNREVFAASQNRIMTMALVHEQLYNSDSLSLVKANQYVGELLSNLKTISGREDISFQIQVGSFFIDIDLAIPCGLIINEVVSNCFKHAFPNGRKGNIGLEFSAKEETYTLKIWDDGIGFKKEEVQKNGKSLGMSLIENLPKQLKAKVTYISEPDKGSSYVFIF